MSERQKAAAMKKKNKKGVKEAESNEDRFMCGKMKVALLHITKMCFCLRIFYLLQFELISQLVKHFIILSEFDYLEDTSIREHEMRLR